MDLREYFKRVREMEARIPGKDTVVRSLKTAEGGKAGELIEVSREVAARMVADGKAELVAEDGEKD